MSSGERGAFEAPAKPPALVILVAERVKELAREELGREVEIKLVDNPRSGETLVENFTVDTTKARDQLGWESEHTVDASVRKLLRARAAAEPAEQRPDQPT